MRAALTTFSIHWQRFSFKISFLLWNHDPPEKPRPKVLSTARWGQSPWWLRDGTRRTWMRPPPARPASWPRTAWPGTRTWPSPASRRRSLCKAAGPGSRRSGWGCRSTWWWWRWCRVGKGTSWKWVLEKDKGENVMIRDFVNKGSRTRGIEWSCTSSTSWRSWLQDLQDLPGLQDYNRLFYIPRVLFEGPWQFRKI